MPTFLIEEENLNDDNYNYLKIKVLYNVTLICAIYKIDKIISYYLLNSLLNYKKLLGRKSHKENVLA